MKELVGALVKFQSEVPAIPKNKKNPFFNSMYAELSTVIEVCAPVLCRNGLAVTQVINVLNDHNSLETRLYHTSGEVICSTMHLPAIVDAQKLTAAITYLRRAQYLAIVGLVAEDDEDGNNPPDKNKNQNNNQRSNNQQTNQNRNEPPKDNRQPNNTPPANNSSAPVLASDAQKKALTRLYELDKGGKVDWDINKINKDEASNLIKSAPAPKK